MDTAPPTLTYDLWLENLDMTLAYLSVDGGKSWRAAPLKTADWKGSITASKM